MLYVIGGHKYTPGHQFLHQLSALLSHQCLREEVGFPIGPMLLLSVSKIQKKESTVLNQVYVQLVSCSWGK